MRKIFALLLTCLIVCLPYPAPCSGDLEVTRRESLKDFAWMPEEARWIRGWANPDGSRELCYSNNIRCERVVVKG